MNEIEANREKLVLALKDREGSECIHKEGIALCRARLEEVRSDDEGVQFVLRNLPTWSTTDDSDTLERVGVVWFDLVCPFPPVFVMSPNVGWTICFDAETVRDVTALMLSGAGFGEVVSRLNRLLRDCRTQFRVSDCD
jgi:hypothetical protein